MHPLIEDVSKLKDPELEAKIQSLSKKYWQASGNWSVQQQITMLIDSYTEELRIRREKLWKDQQQNRDKNLDELIKVN